MSLPSSEHDKVATAPVGEVARRRLCVHLSLQQAEGIGPVVFNNLLSHFGSAEAILGASVAELEQAPGVGGRRAQAALRARDLAPAEAELAKAEALGVRIICREDSEYPAALTQIADPPICLYVRGTIERRDSLALAVVGARRCSRYGLEQASRFAGLMARMGVTVVSGMARGIDSAAHRAALDCGGRTIAVLGNGLAGVYPPENHELHDAIVASGAVISELPLDAPPDSANFPRRNRIIIGMSLGVLVVEAGQRSGALITARLAGEYNREVFAIPGRLDSAAAVGTNQLIRDGGAKLVMELDDIIDELGAVGQALRGELSPSSVSETARTADEPSLFDPADLGAKSSHGEGAIEGLRRDSDDETTAASHFSDDERRVLAAFTEEEIGLDELYRATQLPIGRLSSALAMLQIKGLLRQLPGNQFVRKRKVN